MFFRRKTLYIQIFSLLGIFVFAGFGCQGLSVSEQAAIQPIVLNYWTVNDNVDELNRLAAAYKQIRSYVTVNVRQVRYEEFDKLFVNALADEVAPDLVSIHTRSLARYETKLAPMPATVRVASVYTKGKYAPETVVTTEIQRLPTLGTIRASYMSTVAEDVTRSGVVYGLPLSVDTLAIYYNKDLLDQAGIPLPPTSWPEFLEAVKKTTKFNKDGEIVQSGVALGTGRNIENSFDIISLLLMQNNIRLAEGSVVTLADAFQNDVSTNHPVLEALRFYTDFARPTKEVYAWNETFPSAFESFARGKSAFYIGFAYEQNRIRAQAPQMNVAVIPMLQLNPGAPANSANYWLQSVVRKSRYQNEAWDFIRFISLPSNIQQYVTVTGQPSPLRIHLQAQKENPQMAPFVEQILNAKNWYHGRDIDTAKRVLDDLVRDYVRPYRDDEDPVRRDANMIIEAATYLQQTM